MNPFSLKKAPGQNIAEMGLVCGLVFLSSLVAISQGGSQIQQIFGHVSTSMTSALVSQGQQNQNGNSSNTVSAGNDGHNNHNGSNNWSELHGIPNNTPLQNTVSAGLSDSRITDLNSQSGHIGTGGSLNSTANNAPHPVANNPNSESAGGMGSQNWVELNNWTLLQNHGGPQSSIILSSAQPSNSNTQNPLAQTEIVSNQQANVSPTQAPETQQQPMTMVQAHVTVPGVMGIPPATTTQEVPTQQHALPQESPKHDDESKKNTNTQLLLNDPNAPQNASN